MPTRKSYRDYPPEYFSFVREMQLGAPATIIAAAKSEQGGMKGLHALRHNIHRWFRLIAESNDVDARKLYEITRFLQIAIDDDTLIARKSPLAPSQFPQEMIAISPSVQSDLKVRPEDITPEAIMRNAAKRGIDLGPVAPAPYIKPGKGKE